MSSRLYSSTMTGEPFLYFEFKQVAKLKMLGLSDKEIRDKVKAENLFQYKTGKSVNKVLPAVMRRVAILDSTLLRLCISGYVQTSKLIVLYSIAKTNRLFYDFLRETYGEKLLLGELRLQRRDLNRFFTSKAEQNENVAQWTENTIAKLKQVFTKILLDAGLMSEKYELTPPIIEAPLEDHLKQRGERQFLSMITGGIKCWTSMKD